MLIIQLVAVRAVEADPSRLVSLRRPLCVFVDNSFFALFAKFPAGQVILPENQRFCLFLYRVRPG